MAYRIVERLRGLARKRAPRGVGNGARDHDRQARADFVEIFIDGEQRRLGVQGVENRFEQNDVGAAIDEAAQRLAVSALHLVEVDGAEAGVVHVGRQ